MTRLFLKVLSYWNINMAVRFYHRIFSKKPSGILDVFSRWQIEEELSKHIAGKIQLVESRPNVPFLDIGIVLDIWDYNANRWLLSALLQTAKHYAVAPSEVLRNYQIIVTPRGDYHGRVWARRIIQHRL